MRQGDQKYKMGIGFEMPILREARFADERE